MEGTSPIVEMRNISITFPGVKALDGVDFRLFPGEVQALMGENGAGKSTLIKALTGVYAVDEGTILLDGKPVHISGTADAQSAGISTVYQEVNLCTNLTVGENVMLGHETKGKLGINWKRTYERASEALARLGLQEVDPRQPLADLSLALQQLVAISRSMVTNSRVLILDEPTSSLDNMEVEQLFTIIRQLRDEGVAILFVSHFLDQVYAISDRMTILRNGQFVGEHMTGELPRAELISAMIGKDAAALEALGGSKSRRDFTHVPVVYEATELGRVGFIEPVDLTLRSGEVLGIAGLLGSGRTELARLVSGADRPDSGTVKMHGSEVEIKTPAAGLKHNIALSSENRRDEGIIRDLSVRENILLALQSIRGWANPVPRKEADGLVEQYVDELNVRPANSSVPIRNLSGGNQQKALLGRWLATNPEVLILDEPTRGIDVGAKAEIQERVLQLAEEGMAVIFISSELEEVVRLSDRILVLKDHRLIAELVNDGTLTPESIVNVIAQDGVEQEPEHLDRTQVS